MAIRLEKTPIPIPTKIWSKSKVQILLIRKAKRLKLATIVVSFGLKK